MRNLSDVEKRLIKDLIAKDDGVNDRFVARCLGDLCSDYVIAISEGGPCRINVHVRGRIADTKALSSDGALSPVVSAVIRLHDLLGTLAESGMIVSFLQRKSKGTVDLYRTNATNESAATILPSPWIDFDFAKVLRANVIVTESLRQFVKNGFMTDEDLKHRKNTRRQWFAIWSAIVISALTSIVNLLI